MKDDLPLYFLAAAVLLAVTLYNACNQTEEPAKLTAACECHTDTECEEQCGADTN